MILHTELNPWACDILRKNFPDDEILQEDIREIDPAILSKYREVHFFAGIGGFGLGLRWAGWDREIWTGGFPCQDISVAGKGAGLSGERSGLWWDWLRLVRACRPVRLLIENVPALRSRGADEVLGSLEELGYTCRPMVVGAVHAGALHRRARVFIVAKIHSDTAEVRYGRGDGPRTAWSLQRFSGLVQTEIEHGIPTGKTGGISDGLSRRMDRLGGLGNAVVPQVVEMIARSWMAAE